MPKLHARALIGLTTGNGFGSGWGIAACVGVGLLAYAPGARAAGTALPLQDSDSIAHAFAGAAVDDSPAIAYTNPAGMVLIQGNEFEGDLNYYDINSSFQGHDELAPGDSLAPLNTISPISAVAPLLAPAVSAGGAGHVNHFLESTLIPGTFAVNSLPYGLKAGLTVTTPNGGRIKYPENFVGRYQGLEALLTEIQVGIPIAVPLGYGFSVGAGPEIDWFQNYVSLNTDEGLLNGGTPDGNGAVGRFRGTNNYAFGYEAGAMWQLGSWTRIGVAYHSRINHDFKGTETVGINNSLRNELNFLGDTLGLLGGLVPSISAPAAASPATDKFVFPQSVTIGFYQRLAPQLVVMVSGEWYTWATNPPLIISDPTTASLSGGAVYTPFHFRNSWTVGAGLDFYPLPKLKLMSGVGYDETPVLSAYRNDLLPDNNRIMVGGGLSYQMLSNVAVHLAYAHFFIANSAIEQTRQSLEPTGTTPTAAGTLTGEYNIAVNVFSTGVTLSF